MFQTVVGLIEGLSKLDIAEIRTMNKPPAAVEIVLEAVMILLTGRILPYHDIKKLMGSGESILLMLREFRLSEITDDRLKMIEPYVDNPLFKPENVLSVSMCASKFCGWVLGVVQAARWQRGLTHKRIDLFSEQSYQSPPSNRTKNDDSSVISAAMSVASSVATPSSNDKGLTFVQVRSSSFFHFIRLS